MVDVGMVYWIGMLSVAGMMFGAGSPLGRAIRPMR
jgi:hypothetical protein